MSQIKAIIFDLDGVIADTAHYHYLAWKRIGEEVGIDFTPEDYEAMKGFTRTASLRYFARNINVTAQQAEDWMHLKGQYYTELLAEMTQDDILPGVVNILDEARERGIRLAVGSASRAARPVLRQLNLIERFDIVADKNDVVNGKPAPDVFLWAAGALGVPPYSTLIFEDSETGVTAARQGGFAVIGVGDLSLTQTLFNLKSLDQLPFEALLEQVERAKKQT